MKLTNIFLVVTATSLALAGMTIAAEPVKATIISNSNGNVQNLDILTGSTTSYSNSTNIFGDIALSNTGDLYGIEFPSSTLYKINPGAGGSTLIGSAGVFINGLGFDASNNLFGTGDSGFYAIDTTTGTASLVANIANFDSAGDIVFDPSTGKFLALSTDPVNTTLFSIDLNGSATQIGNVGFTNVFGLAFEGGNLYGYTADKKQLIIDRSTGAGVFSLNVATSGSIYGSASFDRSQSTAVPEPFSIIGSIFGLGSGVAMKRKLAKAQADKRSNG